MRSVGYLLLVVALLLPLGVYARKRKKTQQQEEIFDGFLRQPDAPMMALRPQEPLDDDMVLAHQALQQSNHQAAHVVGKSKNKGIDVSHYQGVINWRDVAKSGEVSYVYIKATEGGNLVDNTYRTNLNGARKAGLRVGVYHFFSPRASVEEQFRNFTNNVKLKDMDLIPIIDVEHIKGVTREQLCAHLKKFLQKVEKHYGVEPIIYTSARFYNQNLSKHFSGYKYMIARYHTEVPELTGKVKFVMWQYTCTGKIRGIKGDVDRSRFMDNYDLQDILLKKKR